MKKKVVAKKKAPSTAVTPKQPLPYVKTEELTGEEVEDREPFEVMMEMIAADAVSDGDDEEDEEEEVQDD